MAPKKPAKSRSKKETKSNRASISFPPDLYRMLSDIAKAQKVSVAWVMRDAAEKYVADKWPLLSGGA